MLKPQEASMWQILSELYEMLLDAEEEDAQ